MLKIGIIGLPNVGKSSLFNLITSGKIEVANYPFTTIEPNVGIAKLKDQRLEKLSNFYPNKKVVFPLIKFWDIAGLVKGANQGEGMGNKFLDYVRSADALIHVVRCFSDKEILHINNNINPLDDFEAVNLELILADIEIIEKKLVQIEKTRKSQKSFEIENQRSLLLKMKTFLNKNKLLNSLSWTHEEQKLIKEMNLFSLKKMLVLINVDENFHTHFEKNNFYQKLEQKLKKNHIPYLYLAIQFELNLQNLSNEEIKFWRKEYQISENCFTNFLQNSYSILGLSTFFTTVSKEIRGWSFFQNSTAKQCAAIIHSDFAKGFIRCNVIGYDKLISAGSEIKAKEQGLIRAEGKDYIVKDGDICHFLFNI